MTFPGRRGRANARPIATYETVKSLGEENRGLLRAGQAIVIGIGEDGRRRPRGMRSEIFDGKILHILADDQCCFSVYWGRQDVPVIRIGQIKFWNKRLVATDIALRQDIRHPVARDLKSIHRDMLSVCGEIAYPLCVNTAEQSRGEFSRAASKARADDAGLPVRRKLATFHLGLFSSPKSLRPAAPETLSPRHPPSSEADAIVGKRKTRHRTLKRSRHFMLVHRAGLTSARPSVPETIAVVVARARGWGLLAGEGVLGT